jgi:L-threonylcarbamoyladenylate synthase
MKILKTTENSSEEIIKQAVNTLLKGGLIVYPTETCYGLGADATNQNAVQEIFDYKGFRQNKPISIAVSGIDMAKEYVNINPTAENIYHYLLPGPITVVSKSKGNVAEKLEAKTGTLGVRVPKYTLILNLLNKFGQPITATSANISNGKTPYTIKDILSQLSSKKKKLISLIIDAGKLKKRPPSSVVDTTLNEIKILRQGEIDFSQLKTKSIITDSARETINLGNKITLEHINRIKNKCLIFALQGDLGAGKTQFAKGIAAGLGIKKTITSPTFTMIKEYNHQKGIFYHLDAWRMDQSALSQLDWDNYLQPGNVIAIEWIQKGKKLINKWKLNPKVKVTLIEISYSGKINRKIKYTT